MKRATDQAPQDVAAQDRAPILRRYLALAPGARPHVSVARTAPLEEFERVADQYPVFRIVSSGGVRPAQGSGP
jgi:hypothetical protein